MKILIILKIIAQIDWKFKTCRKKKKELCCKFKKINLFKSFWADSEAVSWLKMAYKIDLAKVNLKDWNQEWKILKKCLRKKDMGTNRGEKD
jgi:hypothetical protein